MSKANPADLTDRNLEPLRNRLDKVEARLNELERHATKNERARAKENDGGY